VCRGGEVTVAAELTGPLLTSGMGGGGELSPESQLLLGGL